MPVPCTSVFRIKMKSYGKKCNPFQSPSAILLQRLTLIVGVPNTCRRLVYLPQNFHPTSELPHTIAAADGVVKNLFTFP